MKITFTSDNATVKTAPHPMPTKKVIPQWYKDMPNNFYHPTNTSPKNVYFNNFGDLVVSATIKRCPPIQDLLTTGYTISLWSDIAVVHDKDQNGNERLDFRWLDHNEQHVTYHPNNQIKNSFVEPLSNDGNIYKFLNPWYIKTPPGYSCYIQTPQYTPLPYNILPGIVDTDTYHEVAFPFIWNGKPGEPAQTLLAKGTPVANIIPFKREAWVSSIEAISVEDQKVWHKLLWSNLGGLYRKLTNNKRDFS